MMSQCGQELHSRMTHHEQFVDDSNDQVLLWAPKGHPQGCQQCCSLAIGNIAQLPLL